MVAVEGLEMKKRMFKDAIRGAMEAKELED